MRDSYPSDISREQFESMQLYSSKQKRMSGCNLLTYMDIYALFYMY